VSNLGDLGTVKEAIGGRLGDKSFMFLWH